MKKKRERKGRGPSRTKPPLRPPPTRRPACRHVTMWNRDTRGIFPGAVERPAFSAARNFCACATVSR